MDWRELREDARKTTEFSKYLNNNNPIIREGLADNKNINNQIIKKLLKDKAVNVRIKTIENHKEYAKNVLNDKSWKVRYAAINNNYLLPKKIIKKFSYDLDIRVSSKAKEILDIMEKYTCRKDINNTITIKLVIPSGCNAKCFFCYGNGYNLINIEKLKKEFLDNFLLSLEKILLATKENQIISLDITGGEPTIDSDFLIKVLDKLRGFYLFKKITRVTLTSNGYKLKEIISSMKGVVDYVNISIHHYNLKEREKIFKAKVLTDEEYKDIVLDLMENNIKVSAVAIVYKRDNKFNEFRDNFISWAENIGFVSLRFRKNAFWKQDKIFLSYMNQTINDENFILLQSESNLNATWSHLSTKNGFFIYFISNVLDTTQTSLGIEFVINDDGLGYVDFDKKIKFCDYKFPLGYVFDINT